MSTYDSPIKARPSFFSQHEPQMHSHIYRSGSKNIQHMHTDPTLLHHHTNETDSPHKDS